MPPRPRKGREELAGTNTGVLDPQRRQSAVAALESGSVAAQQLLSS